MFIEVDFQCIALTLSCQCYSHKEAKSKSRPTFYIGKTEFKQMVHQWRERQYL